MEEQIILALNITWDIIKNWWWVFLPFILYRPFLFWWQWWRNECWMFAQKKVLLEVKMPKEVLKPLRAMEQVFAAVWGNLFDPADRWENWIEGKLLQTMQLEMVSLGGEPHLYIRVEKGRRKAIESSIYSQYPDAEILEVDDYTKYVPQSLPNQDWDIWGSDFILVKDDIYPIKTYSKFFEEKPDAPKEEKRIDPMATLLEGMGKLGPGEQLWIQIAAKPIINSKKTVEGEQFYERGRKLADKLAKRPETAKSKSILREAAESLATGKPAGAEENKEDLKIEALLPPEARLTPGEKDIVTALEEKISKRMFKCYIRFIYLAKREVYFGGAKGIPFGFFNQFATENLNQLKPWPVTLTKIKKSLFFLPANLVQARRLYIRKRRLFFRYIKRFDPLFPKPSKEASFLLNTEELATIFHFPGMAVAGAPFVSRVESKKGEAPFGLPMEEEGE